jgi:hypothetical protein
VGKQPENALHIAVRWAGRAIVALACLILIYDFFVAIACRLVPPGKARRRLARKLGCETLMVPHALVCYAAIYQLVALIVLLCLCGVIMIFAG